MWLFLGFCHMFNLRIQKASRLVTSKVQQTKRMIMYMYVLVYVIVSMYVGLHVYVCTYVCVHILN